jgi:hypothetical protein
MKGICTQRANTVRQQAISRAQGRTSAPRDRQDDAAVEINPNVDSSGRHRRLAGGWGMDVKSAVLAMVPSSMNAAGCARWAACPLAAASFARQIWELPSTPIYPGRGQRWYCRLAHVVASGYAMQLPSTYEILVFPCPAQCRLTGRGLCRLEKI